jgi:hypothetical protein
MTSIAALLCVILATTFLESPRPAVPELHHFGTLNLSICRFTLVHFFSPSPEFPTKVVGHCSTLVCLWEPPYLSRNRAFSSVKQPHFIRAVFLSRHTRLYGAHLTWWPTASPVTESAAVPAYELATPFPMPDGQVATLLASASSHSTYRDSLWFVVCTHK